MKSLYIKFVLCVDMGNLCSHQIPMASDEGIHMGLLFFCTGESVTGQLWNSHDTGSIPVGCHYNPRCVHTTRKHGARISRGEI